MDDDLIAEAAVIPPARRTPLWAKYAAAAACLCLCTVAVLSFPAFLKCGSMAPESANDAAVMDREDYDYTYGDVQDTVSTSEAGVAFLFYTEDGKHSYWQEYPNGRPDAAVVFTDYLRAAGCEIACLSVSVETEGEKDEVLDYGGESVIVHTVGVTTVTVTLDGIPEENILRGLCETVRAMGAKVVSIHADGQEIWHGEW